MRSALTLVLLALLLVPFCGCVQYASLIELNPNGSGKLILRFLFSNRGNSPAVSFALSQNDKKQEPSDKPSKWTEQQLEKTREELASLTNRLGEGVTLVSEQAITKAGWTGVQATYAFQDINHLRLSGGPPTTESADSKKKTGELKKPPKFVFKYVPGEMNELTIDIAPSEPKEKAPPKPLDPFEDAGLNLTDSPSPSSALAKTLVKTVFQDARFSSLVKINGQIVETNAQYRPKPNSFFLLDLDFGEFTKSEAFDRIVAKDLDFLEMIKDEVPGLRAQKPGETITVRFRAVQ